MFEIIDNKILNIKVSGSDAYFYIKDITGMEIRDNKIVIYLNYIKQEIEYINFTIFIHQTSQSERDQTNKELKKIFIEVCKIKDEK